MNIFDETTILYIESLKQKYKNKKIVVTAGAFDLFHCGHVLMFNDAKQQGDVLIILLQTNPNLDRPTKNIPIQDYEERFIQITGSKYVDDIIKYQTEDDLLHILQILKPDVRVIGTDWKNKPFTGHELPISIYWHIRTHGWSSSYLRDRVYQSELNKSLNHQSI